MLEFLIHNSLSLSNPYCQLDDSCFHGSTAQQLPNTKPTENGGAVPVINRNDPVV